METIKAKIWDSRMKEWVPEKYFDDLIIWREGKLIISDRFKLCLWTGLKEKNKREIFEGDILKSIYCKSFGKNDVWYFILSLVEIEKDFNYGYKFNWKRIKEEKIKTKTKEDYEDFKKQFEVFGKGEVIIGNKFENSELLGDKK